MIGIFLKKKQKLQSLTRSLLRQQDEIEQDRPGVAEQDHDEIEQETGVVAEQDHEIEETVGSSRVQFEQLSESDETEDELPHNRIAELALAGTLDSRQGCAIHNLKINILIYLYEKINHI